MKNYIKVDEEFISVCGDKPFILSSVVSILRHLREDDGLTGKDLKDIVRLVLEDEDKIKAEAEEKRNVLKQFEELAKDDDFSFEKFLKAIESFKEVDKKYTK